MFTLRSPFGRVRTLQLAAVLITLVLFLSLRSRQTEDPRPRIYRYTDDRPPRPIPVDIVPDGPNEEAAYLRQLVARHGLSNDVAWFGRRVRTAASAPRRRSMTDVAAAFLPRGQGRELPRARADDEHLRLRTERAAALPRLPVAARSPRPGQVDASALLVGVATTHARLVYANHSLVRDWQRWLTDGAGKSNGATLVLTLHQASDAEARAADDRLRALGIDAVVRRPSGPGTKSAGGSGSSSSSSSTADLTASYVELVRVLAAERAPSKKYLALVDDDVFLPSPGELLRRLAEYPPTQPFYVGAPAERADWVVDRAATVTYGGGAVFLTPPAADQLARLPCVAGDGDGDDANPAEQDGSPASQKTTTTIAPGAAQWDRLLHECVLGNSNLAMHVLPSLYSPSDERYGLRAPDYASGSQPLTLHHHRSRHRFEAGRAHLVASACGEACFLQRFRFRDDWILVNGFALTQYLDGVDLLALDPPAAAASDTRLVAQQHYRDDASEAEVQVAPRLLVDEDEAAARDRTVVTWGGQKRTWRFLDGHVDAATGEVWQAYVRRRGRANAWADGDERLASDVVHAEEEASDVDSVIVLIWEP